MANEEAKSPLPVLTDLETRIDLPVFEVKDNLPELEGPVVIGNNDMESFLAFADAVDAKVVLVQYDYFDPDEYLVRPEAYAFEEYLDDDEVDQLLEQIDEHNESVYSMLDDDDSYKPVACSIFVMYEGTPYGIFAEDVELVESFGETADEFLSRTLYNIYFDVSEEDEGVDDGECCESKA